MTKYYIAADGGGSKLQAVLYDDEMRLVRTARMSGVNPLFKPQNLVEEEMRQMVRELLPEDVKEIERLDMSIVRGEQLFLDILKEIVNVKNVFVHMEGHTALASAGVRYGMVAQAGTGSDVFWVYPGGWDFIGGWGSLLGDEGSGYDIGLKTLKAAIYALDGRGPQTMLLDMIKEEWHLEDLWDMVVKLQSEPDYRGVIAGVTRITAKAAERGDLVALQIFEDAAHEMSRQVHAMQKKYHTENTPIVASGGAWKGCERMFEVFCNDIWEICPGEVIIRPVFDPVVGCVILHCFDQGMCYEEIEDKLKDQFGEFLLD